MLTLRRTALLVFFPALVALVGCGEEAQMGDDEGLAVDTMQITVADVGFRTPESVLHDVDADVYLVSNINGAPTDEDGNGFISRIAADGAVGALKWIDGQVDGVTLDAPKGMAILGDTLFVADITAVRGFHRVTGEPLGSWAVPDATFLNDLTVGDDGTVYVSDSGLNADFSSSGTDAVYRFEEGGPVALAEGSELAGPNGLAILGDRVVVVTFGAPQVMTVPTTGGEATLMKELPGGSLDGVVVLENGSLLVSSWETSSVYHVPAEGQGEAMTVVENVPSPADIGWDADRQKVLIPIFQEDRVEIHPVSTDHDM